MTMPGCAISIVAACFLLAAAPRAHAQRTEPRLFGTVAPLSEKLPSRMDSAGFLPGGLPTFTPGRAVVAPRARFNFPMAATEVPRGLRPTAVEASSERERLAQFVAVGMAAGMVVGTAWGTIRGMRCDTCIAGPVGGAFAGFVGGLGIGAGAGVVAYAISLPFRDRG